MALEFVLALFLSRCEEYTKLAEEAARAVRAATDPETRRTAELAHAFFVGALTAYRDEAEGVRDAIAHAAERGQTAPRAARVPSFDVN
jgi:hypothetical protein